MSDGPFASHFPTFQVIWDSTSLSWLKECSRKYAFKMLHGWDSPRKGIHLMFGGLYASGVEQYAHARARGEDHPTATRTMVRWVLENSGERNADGEWLAWNPALDPDGTPNPDANIKNRWTLVRSLVWNVEDRQGSPFQTYIMANGKPAVELTFKFAAYEIGGEEIMLAGHLDEVVRGPEGIYVKDDKTTKGALNAQYFQQYSPNNQMSLYSIAGRTILNEPVQGVLVRAAQIGVNFARFQTMLVPRPKAVLDEWLRETGMWIRQAYDYAQQDYWPANDKSCFWCEFKKVCSVSPNHREAWLREDFVKREWNPAQARGLAE